jgi:hypothetical protein
MVVSPPRAIAGQVPALPLRGCRRGGALVIHPNVGSAATDDLVLEAVSQLVGADRFDVSVWLPSGTGSAAFDSRLRSLGARVERRLLSDRAVTMRHPLGVFRLTNDRFRTLAELRRRRFQLVYGATSAWLPGSAVLRLLGIKARVEELQEPWGTEDRVGLRPLAGASTAPVAVSRVVLGVSGLAEGERAVGAHDSVPHRSRDLADEWAAAS